MCIIQAIVMLLYVGLTLGPLFAEMLNEINRDSTRTKNEETKEDAETTD